MKRLVVIVGPTAVGKSRRAIELALDSSGEIVNADSRQVYRRMDIGTAKPSAEDRDLVPHHLIDIIEPYEDFSLAIYQQKALQAIKDIQSRGRLPLLVGGSGLYIWAVTETWKIPPVQADPILRKRLETRAAREGHLALFQELTVTDPQAAEKIDPRNVRRVIRALEVTRDTGRPFSELRKKGVPPFRSLIIGLTLPREELLGRIDDRVEHMVEHGLVEEIRNLLEKRYSFDLGPMSGIGYSEIAMYLRGQLNLDVAIQRMKHRTHRLARRQYAWFRLRDDRIHWINADDQGTERAKILIQDFLRR